MKSKNGIDIDSAVTVDETCHMSCEVLEDEIQFLFGTKNTGIHLYFDWPGLARFLRLAGAVVERAQAASDSRTVRFMLSVDEGSRNEHMPAGVSTYQPYDLLSG